jgi:4-hydroxy-tetrahydrodipicolinate synthase
MKYAKKDAKSYARANMKGIWAAALTPFTSSLQVDEDGFRENIRHWTEDLRIDGLFIAGKQAEFFSMSIEERKRNFELAVEATEWRGATIMSCSDQNMDVVIDLARHAQKVGADYIVVHAPVLHFLKAHDETIYEYYKTIAEKVDIGIALWSHPDSGYLLSPQLCAKLADIENVVAIKYSVPRPMYAELTRLAGDRILVSTASEEEWLDNILELGWQVYLCSTPPYLIQTKDDLRMREYTDLAFKGDAGEARRVRDSLDPVRAAFRSARPAEKQHAYQKYWQELLGQVGGKVRRPLLELTEAEKAATRKAFDEAGLGRKATSVPLGKTG